MDAKSIEMDRQHRVKKNCDRTISSIMLAMSRAFPVLFKQINSPQVVAGDYYANQTVCSARAFRRDLPAPRSTHSHTHSALLGNMPAPRPFPHPMMQLTRGVSIALPPSPQKMLAARTKMYSAFGELTYLRLATFGQRVSTARVRCCARRGRPRWLPAQITPLPSAVCVCARARRSMVYVPALPSLTLAPLALFIFPRSATSPSHDESSLIKTAG